MTGSFLVANVTDVVRGALAAAAYAWITLRLGRAAFARLGVAEAHEAALAFALGAAVLGSAWTLVAWAGLAYPPIVAGATLVLALLGWRASIPREPAGTPRAPALPSPMNPAVLAAIVATAALILYGIVQCAANIRGGDLDIYHLVIPRSILWNHRFTLNPFSHDAGFSYGWQVYALPVYLLGGEHGFVLLSSAALVLLLLAIGTPIARRYGPTTAWACVLVASFVLCGVSRESLTNNDVPLMLVEVAALRLAILPPRPDGRALELLVGLLCGFAVAIKPQGLGSVVLLATWLLLRAGRRAPSAAALFACGFAPLALVWPVINLLSYGSPLPQIMLLWPPSTGYLPQMRETMAVLMSNFGIWYRLNYLRLFSQGMEGWTLLLLCGIPFLFFRAARRDPAIRLLLGFALCRAIVLTLLSRGDPAIVFHDRYHLASYIAVGIAVMLAVHHAVTARNLPRWALVHYAAAAAILLATLRLFLSTLQMLTPTGIPGSNRVESRPSLGEGAREALETLAEPPGGGRLGIGSDWAARFLPAGAVVATTAIDPYPLRRPFLQLLPVSQNRIDLAGPPGEILAALRREGAGYLQLTEYSGLNLWMNPLIQKWLRSAREIPQEPGVERLVWFDYPTDKGAQAIYRIAGAAETDPPGAGPVEPAAASLTREPDGTLWARWRPVPFGEVAALEVLRDGHVSSLGGTRAEIGCFPIRTLLLGARAIRLVHRVNGKPSGPIDLPYAPP